MAPLHAAAEEGHMPVVELLLAKGADIEAKERNGYTPLTQAGWRQYWDTAGLLMKAGATCQPPTSWATGCSRSAPSGGDDR